jgi:hypothetical protein
MRNGMSVNGLFQQPKGSRMPVKRSPAKKATASKTPAKPKSNDKDQPANVRDETHETPEVKTRKPTQAEAEQIDNSPGYSAEQLDQMAEYYGTAKETSTVGDVAEIRMTGLAGQKD